MIKILYKYKSDVWTIHMKNGELFHAEFNPLHSLDATTVCIVSDDQNDTIIYPIEKLDKIVRCFKWKETTFSIPEKDLLEFMCKQRDYSTGKDFNIISS